MVMAAGPVRDPWPTSSSRIGMGVTPYAHVPRTPRKRDVLLLYFATGVTPAPILEG